MEEEEDKEGGGLGGVGEGGGGSSSFRLFFPIMIRVRSDAARQSLQPPQITAHIRTYGISFRIRGWKFRKRAGILAGARALVWVEEGRIDV